MRDLIVHVVWGGTLRELCASAVLLVATSLVPLAYASPPDPLWVPGIYDAADYDDVVWLLTDTTFARECTATTHSAFPVVVRVVSCDSGQVHIARTPSALHSRAPPSTS